MIRQHPIVWLMACWLLWPVAWAYAQAPTTVLTGHVTDVATGKAMPFTNVYVNGTTRGAITDEKGYFTLVGVPLGTVEIVASFIGYQPEKRTFRFDNLTPQKANFRLKSSEQTLDAVTVRGNPKRWENHLRQFKKQLFGEPFGGQCQLTNSETLNFKEDKGHLFATASEPLVIENQALGYRLTYDLQHFDGSSQKVFYAGAARFEELKPENDRQANRWQRNRMRAYKGSIRHLMASLIDSTYDKAGFMVFQEDASRTISVERRSITLAAAVSDYKRLLPIRVSSLIKPGRLATERRLVSSMKLIVFNTNSVSAYSPYPDARYAYTEVRLPNSRVQLTTEGVITMPEGMEVQGSMADDRLSTMLPADWKPDGAEKELLTNGPIVTRGKLMPADARMGRIATAFNERFKVLAPVLFLHTDKPFYATGDRLWLSAYLLDAARHQRPGGETAIHVDLLSAAGQLVQHQWMRIADGRGEGNFRLSDTLATGTYRLRAYTDEDDAQRRPAFERLVAVYNLILSDVPIPADTLSQQLDVQILPEGGRWIVGFPARLGLKIVQPNGHGLAISGRIVDDLGAEIARFTSNRLGMTSIVLKPQAQRTYHAELSYQNQLQRVPLPKAETDGWQFSTDMVSDTSRLSLTISKTNSAPIDSAYILVQQRGRLIDQRKIILQNGVAKLSLPVISWLPGIAQITLYDATARPQAERLVFVPDMVMPVRTLMAFNKTRYQPRGQAVLSINLNDNGLPVLAALSASITDAGQVPDDTSDATFQTHLLLTGELRGRIEQPNYYLKNRNVETRWALDDLLLTQGWRRISGTPDTELLGGVSLMGRIVDQKNQPIVGAQIMVASMASGQSFVKSAGADEKGRFRLAGLALADTTQLLIQFTDRQLKNIPTEKARLITEEPGAGWERSITAAAPNWATLRAQLEAARIRQGANADFYRDKTVKMLKEVTVRSRKLDERPEDIRQRSLHNVADATLIFDDKSPVYTNLYEMIQGRLAGVSVTRTSPPPGVTAPPGYQVTVRGAGSFKSGTQPLFLLDGMPIQDPDGTALMQFNPKDIERVEVLKNAGSAGIYGVRGGNGVIAFYTKSARSMQANAKAKEGMTPIQFIGYPSVQREFYVPRYDAETTADAPSGPVDSRDVLYWKPLMQTDSQGHSQLRFPLSDVVRTVRVVIQGITAEGRPVVTNQLIRVQ